MRRADARPRGYSNSTAWALPKRPTGARGHYSGGMQHRLDIAMGLIHRPSVLFLDEPTTGLDPEVRSAMWAEITRLARDEGLTILLTTHYLEEADQMASRLAIVERGRVVVEGPPAELKAGLRGDAVAVDLRRPEANGRAVAALERVAGVREVLMEGLSVRARVDEGATAVPAVLSALESAGSPWPRSPSRALADDVYPSASGGRSRPTSEGGDRDRPAHPLGAMSGRWLRILWRGAVVRRHHPGAAGDLAAAVRRPVRARHRDPGLRLGRHIDFLPCPASSP
jgi:ABC-2 type transport system ATP-binding protein